MYNGLNNLEATKRQVEDNLINPFNDNYKKYKESQRLLSSALQGVISICKYCVNTDCKECELKYSIECQGELKNCAVPRDWEYYRNKKIYKGVNNET